jgi:hypothetical protein
VTQQNEPYLIRGRLTSSALSRLYVSRAAFDGRVVQDLRNP